MWKIFRLVLPARETSTSEIVSVLTGKQANSDIPLSVAFNKKMAYYRLCNWSVHLRIPLAFLTTGLPFNFTAGNYSVNDVEHAKPSLTSNSTLKKMLDWYLFSFTFANLPFAPTRQSLRRERWRYYTIGWYISNKPDWPTTLAPSNTTTSTVYWCIASKLKAPRNFYWMSNMFLWVEIFIFFVCYHVVPERHSQLDCELNGL